MQLIEIDDLHSPLWDKLWRHDDYQHSNYTLSGLAAGARHYSRVYYLPAQRDVSEYRDSATTFLPRHLVVYADDGPVAGLALTVEPLPDRTRLSAFGRPLYLVEDRKRPPRIRKRAAELIHHRLAEIAHDVGAERFHLRDHLVGGLVSPLTELVLRGGGTAHPHFAQVVDLTLPPEELWAELRQNFRRIIGRDRPGFTVHTVGPREVTSEHIDRFRDLHVAFFGRTLRTAASWEAILAAVEAAEGFLVLGHQDAVLVSCGFFAVSDRHSLYVSGVNNRDDYGSGLSHRVIWHAIGHARSLGCTRFEVGERLFPETHSDVAEKFHAIGHFKAGFSNLTETRLDIFSTPLPGKAPS